MRLYFKADELSQGQQDEKENAKCLQSSKFKAAVLFVEKAFCRPQSTKSHVGQKSPDQVTDCLILALIHHFPAYAELL